MSNIIEFKQNALDKLYTTQMELRKEIFYLDNLLIKTQELTNLNATQKRTIVKQLKERILEKTKIRQTNSTKISQIIEYYKAA
jgi:hypothetical protein